MAWTAVELSSSVSTAVHPSPPFLVSVTLKTVVVVVDVSS